MSEKIDYSKGIYDARQLGAGRMFILGVQHMFAMFGATVLVPLLTGLSVAQVWAPCCSTSLPKRRCLHSSAPPLRIWAASPSWPLCWQMQTAT